MTTSAAILLLCNLFHVIITWVMTRPAAILLLRNLFQVFTVLQG
jgi:hypothetical protein